MYGNLEEKLNKINNEIDELGLSIKMCESHINYIGSKKITEKDKVSAKNYESQIGQDAYRRMALQDKLRKLMQESMELQDRLCINND